MLERTGDLAGAERVWSEGIAAVPDASLVYLERGLSELRRGDLTGADADLTAANSRSPHFADPLKGLGDLRARQGRWHEAAELYDRARIYAPAWPELLQAHSVARRQL